MRKFDELREINDWVDVDVPLIPLKSNTTLLDNFIKSLRST
jgi:hypothetical protein